MSLSSPAGTPSSLKIAWISIDFADLSSRGDCVYNAYECGQLTLGRAIALIQYQGHRTEMIFWPSGGFGLPSLNEFLGFFKLFDLSCNVSSKERISRTDLQLDLPISCPSNLQSETHT